MNSQEKFEAQERADAEHAMERARLGDFTKIVERIRMGNILFPDERAMMAAIIEGEFKRPKHRPSKEPERIRDYYIALSVRVLADKGIARKAAVSDVARELKLSESYVQKVVAAHPGTLHWSWKKVGT